MRAELLEIATMEIQQPEKALFMLDQAERRKSGLY
jgi:hypothetical protein